MLKVMAPFALFLYLQGPLQAALQALNYAKVSMMNSLVGALIKTGAIFALASNPGFGIMGAALAIVIGFVLVTLLHFASIAKTTGFFIHIRPIIKLTLLIGATLILSEQINQHLFLFLPYATKTLLAITLTGLIYVFGMIALRLLTKEELQLIPFFKNRNK